MDFLARDDTETVQPPFALTTRLEVSHPNQDTHPHRLRAQIAQIVFGITPYSLASSFSEQPAARLNRISTTLRSSNFARRLRLSALPLQYSLR
jgi:hypothetical protein